MHQMIALEQPVTDRQDVIERAGQQEKGDHAQEHVNDELVMFFYCYSYCGHDKTSC
jgi:hypothetical protein